MFLSIQRQNGSAEGEGVAVTRQQEALLCEIVAVWLAARHPLCLHRTNHVKGERPNASLAYQLQRRRMTVSDPQ